MIDNFENLVNWLSDKDWAWWPFLSLRPLKDQEMGNRMVLILTLIYGSLVGVIFLLLFISLALEPLTLSDILCFLAFCLPLGWILYFVMSKVSFVYFWNRRARRLRHHQD